MQAEERLKMIEEQMKIENEKQKLKKKEEKAAKKEQAAILGKDNSRQKLTFSLNKPLWIIFSFNQEWRHQVLAPSNYQSNPPFPSP